MRCSTGTSALLTVPDGYHDVRCPYERFADQHISTLHIRAMARKRDNLVGRREGFLERVELFAERKVFPVFARLEWQQRSHEIAARSGAYCRKLIGTCRQRGVKTQAGFGGAAEHSLRLLEPQRGIAQFAEGGVDNRPQRADE